MVANIKVAIQKEQNREKVFLLGKFQKIKFLGRMAVSSKALGLKASSMEWEAILIRLAKQNRASGQKEN